MDKHSNQNKAIFNTTSYYCIIHISILKKNIHSHHTYSHNISIILFLHANCKDIFYNNFSTLQI